MQISCWWCISLVRTGFVDLRRRENRDRSHGTIMSRRLRPTDISSRRSCARYRAYRVFSFVFRGERAGRRRGRDVSTESFEKVFRDAKYIYMWFEDSSNYELREEFVYRLNEILILLGWFRSTIHESWKRLGFIDPRSPCKHAPCIRDIERVIFTAIPLSSRSRKRQRRVNASIIDFIDALKNDQRDSIRDDIFFFLFFFCCMKIFCPWIQRSKGMDFNLFLDIYFYVD